MRIDLVKVSDTLDKHFLPQAWTLSSQRFEVALKYLPGNIVSILKSVIPRALFVRMVRLPIYYALVSIAYRFLGRPSAESGETSKARSRRLAEDFFGKYCVGTGLDIGYGGDLLCDNCQGWDFEEGDAQYLHGVQDASFDFVYSSHTLEHMLSAEVALENWWRVVKPGGYLILYVPHRDLYEKKKMLPSRWNFDHKHFFLIGEDEPPDTIGLIAMFKRAISDYEVIYAKACSSGHSLVSPDVHSDGEYSIEAVLLKCKN